MKTLGVLAMTAALIATGASAQGVSERGSPRHDSAISAGSDVRHPTSAKESDVTRPTKAKKHVARVRGTSSFASTPAARTRGGASAFDGDWSVLIQTRAGACEPSFRYGVRIQNGEVLNGGGAAVALGGRVAPNGAVRVSVAAGDQAAHGSGRLSRTTGGGTWQGQGSRGTCAGTWVADRRA
jgi:hypothetical protein